MPLGRAKLPKTSDHPLVGNETPARIHGAPVPLGSPCWNAVNDAPASVSPLSSAPTYAQHVHEALSKHHGGLQTHAIVDWIESRYPGYVRDLSKLKGGVSAALSSKSRGQKPMFSKNRPRDTYTRRQGSFWTIMDRAVDTPSVMKPHDKGETLNTLGVIRCKDSHIAILPPRPRLSWDDSGDYVETDMHSKADIAPQGPFRQRHHAATVPDLEQNPTTGVSASLECPLDPDHGPSDQNSIISDKTHTPGSTAHHNQINPENETL